MEYKKEYIKGRYKDLSRWSEVNHRCVVCGKEFYIPSYKNWTYYESGKNGENRVFFCSYTCMTAYRRVVCPNKYKYKADVSNQSNILKGDRKGAWEVVDKAISDGWFKTFGDITNKAYALDLIPNPKCTDSCYNLFKLGIPKGEKGYTKEGIYKIIKRIYEAEI